jgi:very-short-patch-repair endonuclease
VRPGDPVPVSVVGLEEVRRLLGADAGADATAARVAGRQLNLVTAQQLLTVGMSRTMIRHRIARGVLHRRHHGVYLFGADAMLPGGVELAAVLACGEDAVVRRRSAVALFRVAEPWDGEPEILVPGRHCSRPGIEVARIRELADTDRGFQHGIPIVGPALALLDFAAVATADELERAITEAYALKLVTEEQLRDVIKRHPHRSGAAALRAELDRVGGPMWTASKAERVMKDLVRRADLRMPQTRVKVVGFTADFLWPEYRLIVEVDGYRYHGHRYSFERDRLRDQKHKTAGYEVLRFTWRQLEDEPLRVIAVIAMAIGRLAAA